MLTIDEYIAKMKKANKLNEFDYLKISENMSAVMKYVMSYFNEYLTMETCDAEEIKLKHAADKLQEETTNKYPKSAEFILNFYLQHRIRIHKELEKWVGDVSYFPFFYSDSDFNSLADGFCASYKIRGVDMTVYTGQIATLISEIKTDKTYTPSSSDMIHLDSNIVSWVRETYKQYGVNLIDYASELADSFYQRYVKFERDKWDHQLYYINNYNHRYNDNPFDINQVYENNKHRPFLENKRGELEMLVMHEWLFSEVYDDDYWPEYVNLCITHGRVEVAKNVNVLIPVTISNLEYPEDVPCAIEHIISNDGVIKKAPEGPYILRIDFSQSTSSAWQSTEEIDAIIAVLRSSFKEHGVPRVLEIMAPVETVSFDKDIFLLCCSHLEKKMKKYAPMKVAIVNGSGNKKYKLQSHICTLEDILEFKSMLRERKLHIQFSIDFPALLEKKRDTNYSRHEILEALARMKNSIICLNITDVKPELQTWPRSRTFSDGTDVYYLDKYRYPRYDDFYTMLRTMLNDNQLRYLIPKNIANNTELEILVDNLLRSGFSFYEAGEQNE